MAVDQAEQVDAPSDFGTDEQGVVSRWISEIELAKKGLKPWHSRGEQIIKRYMDERSETNDVKKRRFCLLWANVQTLAPAVYARTPTAVVGRRWKDADPTARTCSEVLERAINFSLDAMDFADMMTNLRDEFLLVARGQAWIRYVPHIVSRPVAVADPISGGEPGAKAAEEIGDGTPPTPSAAPDKPALSAGGEVTDNDDRYDEVIWEEAVVDHVHWKDFYTNPARTWSEVRWCGRRVFMTRAELIDRFGEKKGKACPLNWKLDAVSQVDGKEDTQFQKAEVWELWNKPDREVLWICTAYTEDCLDRRDDPLELKDFFPCPRPLLGTCGPDTTIPTPDYTYYESQAREIDELTKRIGLLTDALKVRGFYAGQENQKLTDLLAAETNTLIPIDSMTTFTTNGGAQGVVQWFPVDMVANVLKSCIETRQQMLEDVFQITGIADIMRGDSDPDETATAQDLKATWGSSRVRDKQKELARFAKDLIRLMGEVISKRFSGDTLAKMTGVKLLHDAEKQLIQQQLMVQAQQAQQMQAAQAATSPQPMSGQPSPSPAPQAPQQPQLPDDIARMMGEPSWEDVEKMLHDDALRSFRIDIETDSTIEPNDQQEKQRRVEFLDAVGTYLEKSLTVTQLAPEMLPVVIEGLKFLVRGFRVGREMEDVIDTALDKLQARASQPQAPQPHDPAAMMKAQASQTDAQAKMSDAQTNQFRAQTDRMEAVQGAAIERGRLHAETVGDDKDRQSDQAMHGQDLQADLQKAVMTAISRHFVRDVNSTHPPGVPTQ